MEKRRAVAGGGGGSAKCSSSTGYGGQSEGWAGMNPEVLALVFRQFPADVLIRTVPFVCHSWRDVAAGPYFWSEIDLEAWCRRVGRSDVADAAVRRLVRRSQGTLRRLSAYCLSNSAFSSAAASGKLLRVLEIPMSSVTDQAITKSVASLPLLAVLDISNCIGITSKGIEALGSSCKALVHLKRNLPLPDTDYAQDNGVVVEVDEGEALAIAGTMPGLVHLQLAYGHFSDLGLDSIITNCRALTKLDIRGCWNVKMLQHVEAKCGRINEFLEPWEDEYMAASDSSASLNGADDGGVSVSSDSSGASDVESEISDYDDCDDDDDADSLLNVSP